MEGCACCEEVEGRVGEGGGGGGDGGGGGEVGDAEVVGVIAEEAGGRVLRSFWSFNGVGVEDGSGRAGAGGGGVGYEL